jgi:hypothetical protein
MRNPEAVARDAQFLHAWCLLSMVHTYIYFAGYDHTPGRLELANAAVQTALRLQPDAGEARLALAFYYYLGLRDYDRARAELAIAGAGCPTTPKCLNTPVTSTAAKVIGKNPRATWSAPLSSTRATFTPSSNWH